MAPVDAVFRFPILITCLILFEILLSQWRHRERLIQHLSQIDPLTNTFNRRRISQSLEYFHQQDPHNPYAVVLLDLDHFKNINDQFGHHTGDTVLIAVSQKLGLHLRESDVVGRFGGEEFILIFSVHDKFHRTLILSGFCLLKIAKISLNSSFFPKPIKR